MSTIFKFKDGSIFTKVASVINGIELSEDNLVFSYDFADHNTTWCLVSDFNYDWMESNPNIKEVLDLRELRDIDGVNIVPRHCYFPLEVIVNKPIPLGPIVLSGCNDTHEGSTVFRCEKVDEDEYGNDIVMFSNYHTGFYMDFPLIIGEPAGSCCYQMPKNGFRQRFILLNLGIGGFRIIEEKSGLSLEVKDGSTKHGAPVILGHWYYGSCQRFKFYWCTTVNIS